LIKTIIELMNRNEEFAVTRDINSIFSLVLETMSIDAQKRFSTPEMIHLNKELDWYFKNRDNLFEYKDVLDFLYQNFADSHKDLKIAIKHIERFNKHNIYQAFNYAKKQVKKHTNIIIGTAYTMKGLEADEVYINDDLNSSVQDVIEALSEGTPMDKNMQTELFVYYVACSRAKIKLHNATMLDWEPGERRHAQPYESEFDQLESRWSGKIVNEVLDDI
jgi:hypothetical protein